ncbi:MAG: DUF4136 domain-containing protein, partial [Flavisolibacter sp.]|nr:DUF4136 domain-containing protein [Flavisolibacter sp.]
MKNLRTIGMMLLAGLLLAGCASVAHIEKDDTVYFSQYTSFAWVDTKEGNNLTEEKVRKAVNAELAKEGWREERKAPDVLLKYDVLVEKALKQNNNPVYSRSFTRPYFNPYTRRWGYIYYPSQFLGHENSDYEVREGTITITMIDAKTDKVIWQGWTTDQVNSKNLT